jgi:NADH kinase
LDHPYTAAPRSVLIVKKWGSRSANRYARDIAESLAHRGVQVFIEPTTVHDYGDAVYPTVLDLLARTDPAAEELFRQNFAPVVSEAFTFPPQPSPLAAASAVVADSAAGSSPQYQQPLLSSMESWRSFTRSPSTAAALGNLDPRECIALARKLDSWQRHIDLVVSVGGDGTLLHVSTLFPHRVPPTLAFGCGSFGFLMPFNPDTAPQALDALLQGRLRVFNRTRLAFKVGGVAGYDTRGAPVVPPFAPTDPHCFHLLNEVVLKHSYGLNVGTGVSEIECRIDGDVLARFQGDGLMIASPTGSTAYSMAAGGSIVHPALQSLLISPICPMTLSSRPLVLPGQATISLTPIHDSVLLEGKFGRVIQPLEVVTVRQSQFPVPVFARANVTTDFVADLGSRMNYARMVRVRREEPFAPSAYGAAPSSAVPAASAAAAAAAAGAAAAAAAPFAPSSAFAPSASAFAAFPGAPYAPLPTPAPAPAAPAVPQTPVHAAFAPVFPRTLAAAAAASAAPGSEAAPVALAPATSAPSAESCGDVCDPAAPPSVAAAAAATAGVDAGVGAAAPAPRSSGTGAPSANSLGPIGSFMSKRAQEDVTQDRDDARSGQRNR